MTLSRTKIIIGIVLLLIVLLGGAWWYLLMNGAPEGLSGIPNPFGTFGGDSGEFATTTPVVVTDEPRPPGTLRKISTSPVAGAVIFERDGTTYARFVERGTGHIFEINLTSGVTTRITGTTIPRTTRAIWSPQGGRVVLITETTGAEERIFAGVIERSDEGEGTLNTIELDGSAQNIAFASTTDTVLYTVPTAAGSTGYAHNLNTNTRTTRFNSALRDIVVIWEPSIVAYTTPTAYFNGYAYTGTGFARLFGGVKGLMIETGQSSRVVSYAENNSLVSRTDTLDGTPLSIPVFPEKCVAGPTESTFWCGAPLGLAPARYPDAWYQGAVSFDDSIWRLDLETGNATLISVPGNDAGEAIDVTDMQINSMGNTLIFINKKNGTLWLQEIK